MSHEFKTSNEQSKSKISNDQSKFKKDASKEGSRGSMSSKKLMLVMLLNQAIEPTAKPPTSLLLGSQRIGKYVFVVSLSEIVTRGAAVGLG